MSDGMFDTLRLAIGFKDSGVPDEQAEGMARAIAVEWQNRMEALATKTDLERLEIRMATKEDLAVLEARMATKDQVAALSGRVDLTATKDDLSTLALRVSETETRLLKTLVGVIAIATAIPGALITIKRRPVELPPCHPRRERSRVLEAQQV